MNTEFSEGLTSQIDDVFRLNRKLIDHRNAHPWLLGALGDPDSGIWFVAENPSLRQVERARNPDGGVPTPEAQWFASKGDTLLRETLVLHGFKTGTVESLGGWKCYVTNVIKQADYAKDWGSLSTARAASLPSPPDWDTQPRVPSGSMRATKTCSWLPLRVRCWGVPLPKVALK